MGAHTHPPRKPTDRARREKLKRPSKKLRGTDKHTDGRKDRTPKGRR